ncbi:MULTISPECIES: hypothetical protein [unclassified Corallococcus]|uniref:hypothetical protein n=1 Tax=unclassified Corallococcus TaxID=2685029 RepID=UPI001A8CCB45|nr:MULTISPECIES: hypothetical protein [unclassified Corallococcus]MBN9687188.1 hypothetical protein [Corallococcus sp. NCSPR001]WAS88985.1 hypothetical protein O0N60_18880 [Corallococcus sp. NCRR]
MHKPKHPGFIRYIDGKTQQEVRRMEIAQVPEALQYAQTPKGWVPVVKVVALEEGNQRTLREYGPGDELLRSTVQVRQ